MAQMHTHDPVEPPVFVILPDHPTAVLRCLAPSWHCCGFQHGYEHAKTYLACNPQKKNVLSHKTDVLIGGVRIYGPPISHGPHSCKCPGGITSQKSLPSIAVG